VRTPDEGFKVIKIIALTLVVQVNEDENADPAEHEPIQPTPSALLASEPHCEKEWNNPKKDEEKDLLSAQPHRIDRCHHRPVLRLPASTSLLRAGGQVERHALPAIRPDSESRTSSVARLVAVEDVTARGVSSCRAAPSQDRERRGVIISAPERSQLRDEQLDIFECCLLVFLEPEAQPAGGEAAVAVRLFPRDQCRQLERLGDRHPTDLPRGYLGEHEVVVFQRPPKDRSRVALRGRRCSSPGPKRPSECKARELESASQG
jgi:hypothetical protein